MFGNVSARSILATAALAFVAGTASAQEAASLLRRASTAMGGDVKSIRYAGEGTG